MNNIFFRFFMLLMAFSFQNAISQNFTDHVSNGTLEVNHKAVPVKIFSTTSGVELDRFRESNLQNNILVILNEDLNDYASSVYQGYLLNGYQALDKEFQPANMQDVKAFKYLYKPLNKNDEVVYGNPVDLDTSFKIWDPSKGIQIGSFTLHFYSLMFVFAFGLGYFIMYKMFKIDHVNEKYLEPLFTWTLVGTILGARLGHVIFYEQELFKQDPLSVLLPIRTVPTLEFTGFSGLASHGAAIMLLCTTLYYSIKIIKKNPLWVYDRLGIVVALAGFFIRMGNFFNSEIIGKATDGNSPFAVLFPQMSYGYGATVPRYPTQVFEAVGYLLLFFLLWFLYKKTDKKYQQGWLFGVFFVILWSIRFFVEFLKEPQDDEFITLGILNTGQILSIPFILIGLILIIISPKFRISKEENQKMD